MPTPETTTSTAAAVPVNAVKDQKAAVAPSSALTTPLARKKEAAEMLQKEMAGFTCTAFTLLADGSRVGIGKSHNNTAAQESVFLIHIKDEKIIRKTPLNKNIFPRDSKYYIADLKDGVHIIISSQLAVIIYHLQNGVISKFPVKQPEKFEGSPLNIVASPDRKRIFIFNVSNYIELWDITNKLHPKHVASNEEAEGCLPYMLPDQKRFVTVLTKIDAEGTVFNKGTMSSILQLWTINEEKDSLQLSRVPLPKMQRFYSCFAVTPNSKYLFAGKADSNRLDVLDITDLSKPKFTLDNLQNFVALAVSPCGEYLASFNSSRSDCYTINLWGIKDMTSPQLIETLELEGDWSISPGFSFSPMFFTSNYLLVTNTGKVFIFEKLAMKGNVVAADQTASAVTAVAAASTTPLGTLVSTPGISSPAHNANSTATTANSSTVTSPAATVKPPIKTL